MESMLDERLHSDKNSDQIEVVEMNNDEDEKSKTKAEYEKTKIRNCRFQARYQSQLNHPSGFGVASLSKQTIRIFQDLNTKILSRLQDMVHWSSYYEDPRQRGYCLLEDSRTWNTPQKLSECGILFYDEGVPSEEAHKIHNHVINNCCITLSLTMEEKNSIYELMEKTNEILKSYTHELQEYELNSVTLDNLVAIQPNLHNGAAYLPLHLDCPRNDGFGIVIVTVAVHDDADVIIVDEGDPDPNPMTDDITPQSGDNNTTTTTTNTTTITTNDAYTTNCTDTDVNYDTTTTTVNDIVATDSNISNSHSETDDSPNTQSLAQNGFHVMNGSTSQSHLSNGHAIHINGSYNNVIQSSNSNSNSYKPQNGDSNGHVNNKNTMEVQITHNNNNNNANNHIESSINQRNTSTLNDDDDTNTNTNRMRITRSRAKLQQQQQLQEVKTIESVTTEYNNNDHNLSNNDIKGHVDINAKNYDGVHESGTKKRRKYTKIDLLKSQSPTPQQTPSVLITTNTTTDASSSSSSMLSTTHIGIQHNSHLSVSHNSPRSPNINNTSQDLSNNTKQRKCWCYPLYEGEMYVLSGYSRNKCAHGILKPTNGKKNKIFNRQSLNFRFGIHTVQQAYEEIDKHWK